MERDIIKKRQRTCAGVAARYAVINRCDSNVRSRRYTVPLTLRAVASMRGPRLHRRSAFETTSASRLPSRQCIFKPGRPMDLCGCSQNWLRRALRQAATASRDCDANSACAASRSGNSKPRRTRIRPACGGESVESNLFAEPPERGLGN